MKKLAIILLLLLGIMTISRCKKDKSYDYSYTNYDDFINEYIDDSDKCLKFTVGKIIHINDCEDDVIILKNYSYKLIGTFLFYKNESGYLKAYYLEYMGYIEIK